MRPKQLESESAVIFSVLLKARANLAITFMAGMARLFILGLCVVAIIVGIGAALFMDQARINELLAKSLNPVTLKSDGRYTEPRSWGVYKVERLVASRRGHFHTMGNHPVRHVELVREYGAAETVAVLGARIDAEELSLKLNGGRRRAI